MDADFQVPSTSAGIVEFNSTKSKFQNKDGNQIIGNNNTLIVNSMGIDKCPVGLPFRNSFRGSITHYHGRKDEIKRIHKMLEDSPTSVLSQAITGLGGVGKTQCALRYAEIYKDEYEIIIFFLAEVSEFLSQEIYKIAEKFQLQIKTKISSEENLIPIRDVMNDLYNSFTRWGHKTLLIFDNAESPRKFSMEYLPMRPKELTGNIKILITSRWQEWDAGGFGRIETFHLGVFSKTEAYEYVMKTLNNGDYFTVKDINELIKIVQCFPLALHQAVSYILEENKKLKITNKKITVADYIKLYNSNKEMLLASGQCDVYKSTVRTTWKLTMEKLKTEHGKCGKRAVKILKIMSFLAPDKIPFKKIFNEDNRDNGSIILLEKFSLVSIDGEHLSVHRLVQDVVKLDIKNVKNNLKKTLKILSKEKKFLFRQRIDDHLYEAIKFSIDHEKIYSQLCKQFIKPPLTLVIQREDCEISVIKKMYENYLKRKNYVVISEMFRFYFNFKKDEDLENLLIGLDIGKKGDEYYPLELFLLKNIHYFTRRWQIVIKYIRNYNIQDDDGETMIMKLCASGDIDSTKALLETGKCKLDLKNKDNDNALHLAIDSFSEDTVNLLMEHCTWNFNQQNKFGYSPFLLALSKGMTAIVKSMLDSKTINFELKCCHNNNVLHLAIDSLSEDTTNLLIKHCTWNYNQQNKFGESSFLLTSSKGMTAVVKSMLDSKTINFDLKNCNDNNVLHIAIDNLYEDTTNLLMEHCTWNFNQQNKFGESPFLPASSKSMTAVVKSMLDSKTINFDLKNCDENNALYIAINSSSEDTTSLLMGYYTWNFNQQNKFGYSPFLLASSKGMTAVVKSMLDSKTINFYQKDFFNNNAMHLACKSKSEDTVYLLMRHYTWDYEKSNDFGETPIKLVTEYGLTEIANEMRNAMKSPAIE